MSVLMLVLNNDVMSVLMYVYMYVYMYILMHTVSNCIPSGRFLLSQDTLTSVPLDYRNRAEGIQSVTVCITMLRFSF